MPKAVSMWHFLTKQTHFATNAQMSRERCSIPVQLCGWSWNAKSTVGPCAFQAPPTSRGCGYGAGTMTLSSGSGTCSRPRIAYPLNRECEIPKIPKKTPQKIRKSNSSPTMRGSTIKGGPRSLYGEKRAQLAVPIIRHRCANSHIKQSPGGAQTPLQLSTPTFRIRPRQPFGTVIIMWVKSQPPPIRHRAVCASRGRHEHVHVHKHRH